jgi:PAS domain S-box-containing protein
VTAPERTAAALLRDFAGLSLEREERFERITRTTQALLGTKAAFLGLIDENRQWVKGCAGIDLPVLDRQDTFCQHVVVQGRLLVVPDLRLDPRFASHEIVTERGFLFYAGQPLRVRGHVVGTLCLLDDHVRDLSDTDRARLADLAEWAQVELLAVENELDERRRPGASVLHTVQKRDELILQFVAAAICGIDTEGFVTFANPAAAELLGDDLSNLVGAHFSSTYQRLDPDGSPRRWEDGETAAAEVLRGGGACRNVVETLQRADGERIEVEYAAAPLVVDSEVLGLVVTFSDISGRRAVERLKDEFVSVVSHELRTPLTSIRGSLGLLASGRFGELPTQGARLVQIALDNTERLVRLVNDILDLERIEAGRADLHPRVQALAPLLTAAVDGVAGAAEQVGVTVTTSAPALAVDVDADFLVRAFTNLIGNAVKFSEPGGAVTVDATRVGAEVRVTVTDTGRGIPGDRLERVFERFEQVDAADNRQKGGTGLGLAITRSIVERHGGRIEVASELGAGSTFTVVLPAPPVAPERVGADGSGTAAVVIVDDDDDIVEVLTAALRQDGIEVASARGVDEAVALVTRLRPALVVLDVQLADGDGFQVAARLRADPDLADTPLVVASVHDLDEADRARLVLGATTVVAKATAGPDLVSGVLAAVRRHVPPAGGAA